MKPVFDLNCRVKRLVYKTFQLDIKFNWLSKPWSKKYSKVTKIILRDLDGISATIISSTTNNRDSKDPYLYKVFNFCCNYWYEQGVDSLQKISVQLCCRGETEVSHFPFHKKRIITLNTSQIRKRWYKDFDLSYPL